MLTTFLAAAIAVVTSFLFPVTVVLADAAQSDVVPQGLGEVMGTLLTNFVANPVSAIMSGNIGILFWACMFGVAMKKIGSDTTKTFMANTADAVSQIVRWIINLAPFGIMGLVYTNVSGNGLGHLYPVRQAAGPAGGHHAVHGPHRLAPHHVPLSGLQPLSAGLLLPA